MSFRRALLLAALLPALAFTTLSSAQEPAQAPSASSPLSILPLEEVRPGMAAVLRTVLSGDRTEELPVEIIGVMENALGPSQSLILARLGGDRAAFTGVAAGMSGSPVYADGRLIGALSYRIGQFTKEPIAGITPIQYMLGVATPPPKRAELRAWLGPAEPEAAGGPRPGIPLVASPSRLAAGYEAAMVPIETPLVVTGVAPEILRHFAPSFEDLGAVAVSGAGGSGPAGASPRPVKPGDAIAAQLVRGDISVAATGTVTYVDGDRVLAFGHPVLLQGGAEFPMARAEIYLTLASVAASTKIPRILDTIGTWEQIRLPGISGVTSRIPSMIPLAIEVDTPGRNATYHYEVASHRDFTPLLVGLSIGGSLVNTPAFADESTLAVTGRMKIEGHPDVVVEDLYTGFSQGASAALAVASDLQGIFGAIFQNRFEAPRAKSIEISAKGIEQGRVSFVESVWPSRTEASPGEKVEYRVRTRSFRGDISTKTITFTVPESAARGDLQVFIGGAAFFASLERQVLGRRVAGADSLDQIIGIVNNLRTSDALYAKIVRRLPGAVVQSEVLPALPPSVLTTLRTNRALGSVAPIAESTLWEDRIQMESIVVGGTALALRVR